MGIFLKYLISLLTIINGINSNIGFCQLFLRLILCGL